MAIGRRCCNVPIKLKLPVPNIDSKILVACTSESNIRRFVGGTETELRGLVKYARHMIDVFDSAEFGVPEFGYVASQWYRL